MKKKRGGSRLPLGKWDGQTTATPPPKRKKWLAKPPPRAPLFGLEWFRPPQASWSRSVRTTPKGQTLVFFFSFFVRLWVGGQTTPMPIPAGLGWPKPTQAKRGWPFSSLGVAQTTPSHFLLFFFLRFLFKNILIF